MSVTVCRRALFAQDLMRDADSPLLIVESRGVQKCNHFLILRSEFSLTREMQ